MNIILLGQYYRGQDTHGKLKRTLTSFTFEGLVGPCMMLFLPAVNHNGVCASPPLNPGHLFHHTSDTAEVGAVAIRAPVGDV